MKRHQDFKSKLPKVTINPDLDKYDGIVLFPKKLEAANEMLRTTKLPPLRQGK